MLTETAQIRVPVLPARSAGFAERERAPSVHVAKRTELGQIHSWLCPGQPVIDHAAKVQMLFWRIHSPTQQSKKKCRQTYQRRKSGKDFAEQTRQRCLRCARTRQPAQTRRAGQLSLLIRYAFAAERSAAVWTPCRRFTQRMKQAASMAQAHRGGRLEGYRWGVRSHSSLVQPRWRRSGMLRIWIDGGAQPLGKWLRERSVAQ